MTLKKQGTARGLQGSLLPELSWKGRAWARAAALVCTLVFALASCARTQPGRLAGTWRAEEPFPLTVTFRDGEVQTMGTTKPVSYRAVGNRVWVTHLDGAHKGREFLYVFVDDNTLESESGVFRKVR